MNVFPQVGVLIFRCFVSMHQLDPFDGFDFDHEFPQVPSLFNLFSMERFFPPSSGCDPFQLCFKTRIAIRACASSLVAFHVILQGLAHGWSFTPARDSAPDSIVDLRR